MELRYCELCGEIIRADSAAGADALEISFVCDACRARKEGSRGAGGTESAPKTDNAESPLADTDAFPEEPAYSVENLNLFSADTVAARKAQIQTETAIRLHDPDESAAYGEEDGGSETGQLPDLRIGTIDTEGPPLSEGTSAEAKADPWAGTTAAGDPAGSAVRSASARKIQFRCLHCPAVLVIRPVENVSKLNCPRCGNSLYVGPQGKVVRTLQELTTEFAPAPPPRDEFVAPPPPVDPDLPPGLLEFLRQTDNDQAPGIGFFGGALRALLLSAILWVPVFLGIYVLNWGVPIETPVSLEEIGTIVQQGLEKGLQQR